MEYKVVLLGGGGVGKSALTIQFVRHDFVDEYDPTIEDSYRKQTQVDGKLAILDILDTAGQDEYSVMREQYMEGADGFIMVYAVNSRGSFEEVKQFRDLAMRVHDTNKFPMVLIANKADVQPRQRRISKSEGEDLAAEWGVPFLETSAKTRTNVEEAFNQIVREVRKTQTWEKKPSKLYKDKKCSLL